MSENKRSTVACPACNEEVHYKLNFAVGKVKPANEVIPNPLNADKVFEDFYRSQAFICPCCGQLIQLLFETKIVGVEILERTEVGDKNFAKAAYQAGRISGAEAEILEEVRRVNLIAPFAEAVKRHYSSPPKNMEHFFLRFLRAMVPGGVSEDLLAQLARKWNGQVSAYRASGVTMFLCDGKIRLFCPTKQLALFVIPPVTKGATKVRAVQVQGRTLHRDKADDFLARTRFGYVPSGSRIFLEALLHSTGDRGREMRPIPLRGEPRDKN